jgi:hypothetical protein
VSLSQYQLNFEYGPIVLNNGVATNHPGSQQGMLNIIQLLNENPDGNLEDFFAHFAPIQGGSLFRNQLGTYPFANQFTAANAQIFQPLGISLRMTCPVNTAGGYAQKLTILTTLATNVFKAHALAGGTYTVMTPSFYYVDCLLLNVIDVSSGTNQPQVAWQLDFSQPLVTQDQAAQAQNYYTQQVSAMVPPAGQGGTSAGQGSAPVNTAPSSAPSNTSVIQPRSS